MRVATDPDGDRRLVVTVSGDRCLVRDPETGAETWLPRAELTITGEAPLVAAAAALPEGTLPEGPHPRRARGLVALLVADGPTPVRELLGTTECCESALHGVVADLRAAGLLAATTVAGERAYAATERAHEAVATRG